jgi:hypothetical protein
MSCACARWFTAKGQFVAVRGGAMRVDDGMLAQAGARSNDY